MEILGAHFQKVFNNKRTVRFEILDNVLQRDIMRKRDGDICYKEFEGALDGIENGKAQCENGVPPDAIKALNKTNRRRMF